MQENRVQSPVQEDPLEKGISTHSSVLPRETLWTEEPGRLQSIGLQRVRLALFRIDVIVKFLPYLKTRKRGILRICMLK